MVINWLIGFVDDYKRRSAFAQICLNPVGRQAHKTVVAIPVSCYKFSFVLLFAARILLSIFFLPRYSLNQMKILLKTCWPLSDNIMSGMR